MPTNYSISIKTKRYKSILDSLDAIIMKEIILDQYSIVIGDAQEAINRFLRNKEYSSISVIVDENTKAHCLNLLSLPASYTVNLIEIQSGEIQKTITTCQQIWQQISEHLVDRHGLVINLGGGVIGDMGGFAASCYMRGIDFVQIPTTLLSQVDASIGGKLAVDFLRLKNFIGLFKNPNQVIVDPNFLKTLPKEELRSGYAEMLKHALIRDHQIWNSLKTLNWSEVTLDQDIYESILIKKDVVEEDPTEQGLRKILNFGHTIGHAVETLSFSTDYPLLHGEAIGIGMICEAFISNRKIGLPSNQLEEITHTFLSIYNDLHLELLSRSEEIITLLTSDKKNKGGKLLFSLIDSIGSGVFNIEVTPEEIRESLIYLINQLK